MYLLHTICLLWASSGGVAQIFSSRSVSYSLTSDTHGEKRAAGLRKKVNDNTANLHAHDKKSHKAEPVHEENNDSRDSSTSFYETLEDMWDYYRTSVWLHVALFYVGIMTYQFAALGTILGVQISLVLIICSCVGLFVHGWLGTGPS